MKRDMDLIRLLLLELENEEKPDLSNYPIEQIRYHKGLLIESGLVHGSVMNDGSGNIAAVMITRLTWEGHEFLEVAKNDSIWNKAKELISKANLSINNSHLTRTVNHNIERATGNKMMIHFDKPANIGLYFTAFSMDYFLVKLEKNGLT